MSSSSFPTICSELFRLVSPAITKPPSFSGHILDSEVVKLSCLEASEGKELNKLRFSDLNCQGSDAVFSQLRSSEAGYCSPIVTGLGASPLSWKSHAADPAVPLLPFLASESVHHASRLFSSKRKSLERWNNAQSGQTIPGQPYESLLLPHAALRFSYGGEEEGIIDEDGIVSYFSNHSLALSRLCSRGSSWMVKNPFFPPHSLPPHQQPLGDSFGSSSSSHGTSGTKGNTARDSSDPEGCDTEVSPFFMYILHPQHHHLQMEQHQQQGDSRPSHCTFQRDVKERIPLTDIQRIQEISVLLALLQHSRIEYGENPAFLLFWSSAVQQRVGLQLLTALEESWSMWKKTRGVLGPVGTTSVSNTAASSSAGPSGVNTASSSFAIGTLPSELFSARCMLYAEALLFYVKHKVEELYEAAACFPSRNYYHHHSSSSTGWAGSMSSNGAEMETGSTTEVRDEKDSVVPDKSGYPFSFFEVKEVLEKEPEEDNDEKMWILGEAPERSIHRIFQLLCEFSAPTAGAPFQRRVALLLLGILCLWNRLTPLCPPIAMRHVGCSATGKGTGCGKDINGAPVRVHEVEESEKREETTNLPHRPTVGLGTLQESLIQHFTDYFCTTTAATAASIGNEEQHRYDDKVLSLPSFFVALLLLQYPPVPSGMPHGETPKTQERSRDQSKGEANWKAGCSSVELSPSENVAEKLQEEKCGKKVEEETCNERLGTGPLSCLPPEWLDAHLDRWNRLAPILTYGRMYDMDLTVLVELEDGGTQSTVLALIKELLGDAEKAVWAQIHHSSWWGHFSFPSLLSACRGITLFSYTWANAVSNSSSLFSCSFKDSYQEDPYIPHGVHLLLTYLQTSMRELAQKVCDIAARRDLCGTDSTVEKNNHLVNEESFNPFPSFAGGESKKTATPFPSSSVETAPVPSSAFVREAEETLNSYFALYAHVCGVFMELDVNGTYNAGELLFLPFSLQKGENEAESTPPHELSPAQWAALDALFSYPFSCSSVSYYSYSSHASSSVSIPLLPKYMMFLQHALQSPRLEQHMSKWCNTAPSFFLEEPNPSSSFSSPAILSVTDGVFLEAASTVLFSMLSVVSFAPALECSSLSVQEEENKRTEEGEETVLQLLHEASGGVPLVVLLQRLFLLYTVVSKPQIPLLSRLFTCVERCFRELSLAKRCQGGSTQATLFPGQCPGLSFASLAANAVLTPSLLQHLGESPRSVCLGVLHAHLYGSLALQEMKNNRQQLTSSLPCRGDNTSFSTLTAVMDAQEDKEEKDGPFVYLLHSSSSLSMAHLLGSLTYLPPGRLSQHPETLTFYLTVLRYLCSLETSFTTIEEETCSLGEEEENEEEEENSSRRGEKEGRCTPPPTHMKRGSAPRPGVHQASRRLVKRKIQRKHVLQWWWWWLEKEASALLSTYPSLLSTLMEAAAVLQGRVAAGYLYGVEGPLQGALERTWRIIAVLTTAANAHALLVNTVIPVVVVHAGSLTAGSHPDIVGGHSTPEGAHVMATTTAMAGAEGDRGGAEVLGVTERMKGDAPHAVAQCSRYHCSYYHHTSNIPALTLLLEVVFSSSSVFHPQIQLLCASLWCASLKNLASSPANATRVSPSLSVSQHNSPHHPFHVLRLALGTTASRLLAALRSSHESFRKEMDTKGEESNSAKNVAKRSKAIHNGLMERLLESLEKERGEVSNVLRWQVLLALQRFDSRLFMQFFLAPQFAAASTATAPAAGACSSSPSSMDEKEIALTSLSDLRVVQLLQEVVRSPLRCSHGSAFNTNIEKGKGGERGVSVAAHPQERALAWFLLLGMKLVDGDFLAFSSSVERPQDGGATDALLSVLFPFPPLEESGALSSSMEPATRISGRATSTRNSGSPCGAELYQAAAAWHFWLSLWLQEKYEEACAKRPAKTVAATTLPDPSFLLTREASSPIPQASSLALLLLKKSTGMNSSSLQQDKEALWLLVEKSIEQLESVQHSVSLLLPSLYRRDTSLDWWQGEKRWCDLQHMMQAALDTFSCASPKDHNGSALLSPVGEPGGHYSTSMVDNGSGTSLLLYPLVLVSSSCFSSLCSSSGNPNSSTIATASSQMEYEFLVGLPRKESEAWNCLASLLYSLQPYCYALEKSIVFLHSIETEGEEEREREHEGPLLRFPSPGNRKRNRNSHRHRRISVVLVQLLATLMETASGSALPAIAWLQQQCVATCLRLLHTLSSIGFLSAEPYFHLGGPSDQDETREGQEKKVSNDSGGSSIMPPSERVDQKAIASRGVRHTSFPSGSYFFPFSLLSAIRYLVFDFLPKQPRTCPGMVTNILLVLRTYPIGNIFYPPATQDVDAPPEAGACEKKVIIPQQWSGWGNTVMRQVIEVIAAQLLLLEREGKARPPLPYVGRGEETRRTDLYYPSSPQKWSRPGSVLGGVTVCPSRVELPDIGEEEDEKQLQHESEKWNDEEKEKRNAMTDAVSRWDTAKDDEKEAFIEAANLFFISHGQAMQQNDASLLSDGTRTTGATCLGILSSFGASLRTITTSLVRSLENLAHHIPVWGPSSCSNLWVARFTARMSFLQTLLRAHPFVQGYIDKTALLTLGGALGQLRWMPPVSRRPPSFPSHPETMSCAASSTSLAPVQYQHYQCCAAQELWCALLELFRTLLTGGGGGVHPDSLFHPFATGWAGVLCQILSTPRFQYALSGFGPLRATTGTVETSPEDGMEIGRRRGEAAGTGGGNASAVFLWDIEEWYLSMQLVAGMVAVGCASFVLSQDGQFLLLVREGFEAVHSSRFWTRFRPSRSGVASPFLVRPQEEKKREEGEEDDEEHAMHSRYGEGYGKLVAERTLAKWYVEHILRDQLYFLMLQPPSYSGLFNSYPNKVTTTVLSCSWPSLFAVLYRYIARQVRTVVQQVSFMFVMNEEEVDEKRGKNKMCQDNMEEHKSLSHYILFSAAFQKILSNASPLCKQRLSETSIALPPATQKDVSFKMGYRSTAGPSRHETISGSRWNQNIVVHATPLNSHSILSTPRMSYSGDRSRSASGSPQRGYSRSPPRGHLAAPPISRLPALLEDVSLSMESVSLALGLFLKGGEEIQYRLQQACPLGHQDAQVEGELIHFGKRLVHTLESIEKGLPDTVLAREFLYFLHSHRQQLIVLLEQLRIV